MPDRGALYGNAAAPAAEAPRRAPGAHARLARVTQLSEAENASVRSPCRIPAVRDDPDPALAYVSMRLGRERSTSPSPGVPRRRGPTDLVLM